MWVPKQFCYLLLCAWIVSTCRIFPPHSALVGSWSILQGVVYQGQQHTCCRTPSFQNTLSTCGLKAGPQLKLSMDDQVPTLFIFTPHIAKSLFWTSALLTHFELWLWFRPVTKGQARWASRIARASWRLFVHTGRCHNSGFHCFLLEDQKTDTKWISNRQIHVVDSQLITNHNSH